MLLTLLGLALLAFCGVALGALALLLFSHLALASDFLTLLLLGFSLLA